MISRVSALYCNELLRPAEDTYIKCIYIAKSHHIILWWEKVLTQILRFQQICSKKFVEDDEEKINKCVRKFLLFCAEGQENLQERRVSD